VLLAQSHNLPEPATHLPTQKPRIDPLQRPHCDRVSFVASSEAMHKLMHRNTSPRAQLAPPPYERGESHAVSATLPNLLPPGDAKLFAVHIH